MAEAGNVESVHLYVVKGAEATVVDGRAPKALTATVGGFEAGGFTDREIFVAAPGEDDNLTAVTPRGWGRDGQRVIHKDDRRLNGLKTRVDTATGALVLEYDGETIQFDGSDRLELSASGEGRPVSLHGGVVRGVELGVSPEKRRDYADFISSVIGREATLMWNPAQAQRILEDGTRTDARAQDGYPYLITVAGSLAALREREGTNAQMGQYRPNIVLDLGEVVQDEAGLLPEDLISVYKIGDLWFSAVSASNRCIVTTLQGGQVVGEGLRTIRSRKGVKLDENGEPRPDSEGNSFGVNASLLVAASDNRQVEAGVPVAVVSSREHPFVRLRQ